MELIKPKALKRGDTIGICTPSVPAYIFNPEMFELGIKNIESRGFKVKLGSLTQKRASQGYRSGSGEERALEFMELVSDPSVDAIVSTIGGMNSNSLIEFLDFNEIRKQRKIFCGYSDVTSLHLSILKYSGLRTFYGLASMPWWGEFPNGEEYSIESFLTAAIETESYPRIIRPFPKWSNHFRDWGNGDWKKVEREWKDNPGWRVLSPGSVEATIVVANLNTLISSAGTSYFPELKGRVLLIEEMAAPFSKEERSLVQLKLMGVFDQIEGLILGKPEKLDPEGALFSMDDLLMEVVGTRDYPIISNFDCSHTVPMHTIAQEVKVRLSAKERYEVEFELLESFVE